MEEDIILIKQARNGDENSLNKLMNNYKNLVNKIAKKYFIIGGEFADVIQEGMIGLFNAYNKFDISKNVLFKTFASVCINRQIITAIKKAYKNNPELRARASERMKKVSFSAVKIPSITSR